MIIVYNYESFHNMNFDAIVEQITSFRTANPLLYLARTIDFLCCEHRISYAAQEINRFMVSDPTGTPP